MTNSWKLKFITSANSSDLFLATQTRPQRDALRTLRSEAAELMAEKIDRSGESKALGAPSRKPKVSSIDVCCGCVCEGDPVCATNDECDHGVRVDLLHNKVSKARHSRVEREV